MKRRIIAILIILSCMLFSNPVFTFAEGATVELVANCDLNTLKPGDILSVNIVAKNVNKLVGGELVLIYDSSHMSLNTKELGSSNMVDFTTLNNVTNNKLMDEPGKTKIIFGLNKNAAPLTGEHVVATLTFNILSKGSGSISIDNISKLISENVDGFLNEIVFFTNQVTYNILGTGNISGIVKNTIVEPVANAAVNILQNNRVVYSTSTDIDGSYNLVDITEGSYVLQIVCEGYRESTQNITVVSNSATEYNITLIKNIVGDTNGDELVTLDDLVFVANYFGLSNDSIEWNNNASIADINNDGKVDILDLILISRKLEL